MNRYGSVNDEDCPDLTSDGRATLRAKLQALLYDIHPPTTAIVDYDIHPPTTVIVDYDIHPTTTVIVDYDIHPTTTAIVDYAIGLEKLSA